MHCHGEDVVGTMSGGLLAQPYPVGEPSCMYLYGNFTLEDGSGHG